MHRFRSGLVLTTLFALACSASDTGNARSGSGGTGGKTEPVNPLGMKCSTTAPSDCEELRAAVTNAQLNVAETVVGCRENALGDTICNLNCDKLITTPGMPGMPAKQQLVSISGAETFCTALGGQCLNPSGANGVRNCWPK